MIRHTCSEIQSSLSAYRDGELPLSERALVGQHLHTCDECRALLADMDTLGDLLREQWGARVVAQVADEPVRHGLAGAVVSRVLAEQEQSWPARLREAFDDMHLVWAGLSAAAAVVLCAGLAAAIVLLGPREERSDSLRAMVAMLASPGTDLDPLPLAPGVQAPRVAPEAITPLMLANDLSLASTEDVEVAISAVVTREGRIERMRLLEGAPNAQLVQSLEDSARFQPASRGGSPVAVSLVWLVSHTTVRPDIVKPQSSRRIEPDLST